jgi:hypothetical protein
MDANGESRTAGGRALAFVALVPAVGVFALDAWLAIATLWPDPDLYLEGHEVPLIECMAVVHLAFVGYAIWGLASFLAGRAAPMWTTALAYFLGGASTPVLWLFWVRWFSGG